jgi:hypothetical protein
MNPDCAEGKHRNCSGDGWDHAADAPAPCPCSCHPAAEFVGWLDREVQAAVDEYRDRVYGVPGRLAAAGFEVIVGKGS